MARRKKSKTSLRGGVSGHKRCSHTGPTKAINVSIPVTLADKLTKHAANSEKTLSLVVFETLERASRKIKV